MDLQQRYGCVAGVPGGAFAGQRSISRFEAAALLLARLRARVDGLPGIACRSATRSASPRRCYLSAPLGQLQKGEGRSFDNLGALIKTSFRF